MSRKYHLGADHHAHFVTFTVLDWIDFFTRKEYSEIFIQSVKYCQEHKGLEVFGYCIMPSHIHLIVRAKDKERLEDIIRDLKRHTSKSYHKLLEDKNTNWESRRRWLLWLMKHAGSYNSNNKGFQFWQQHNHPVELWSDEVFYQKLNYIHLNPVVAGFVSQPEEWLYSSARDHAGLTGFVIWLIIDPRAKSSM
jgi:putative transposase